MTDEAIRALERRLAEGDEPVRIALERARARTRRRLHFVYRSHYEGPLFRRVITLEVPSVLAWFQTAFREAARRDEPRSHSEQQLGGDVYGFGSILDAAKKLALPVPRTTAELRRMLHAHLYVEGTPDEVRLDEHTLRVKTDDDEVDLACFFFDDEALARFPDRLAWLLVTDPRLEDGARAAPFVAPIQPVELEGDRSDGATYACLLTLDGGGSTLPGSAYVFPHVRLPGLTLRSRRRGPRDG